MGVYGGVWVSLCFVFLLSCVWGVGWGLRIRSLLLLLPVRSGVCSYSPLPVRLSTVSPRIRRPTAL